MTSGKTLSSLHASHALLCIAREFCREWTVTCNEHVLRPARWHFDLSSKPRGQLSYQFQTGCCWGSGACRCKISTCKPPPLVRAPSTMHVLVRGLSAELFPAHNFLVDPRASLISLPCGSQEFGVVASLPPPNRLTIN